MSLCDFALKNLIFFDELRKNKCNSKRARGKTKAKKDDDEDEKNAVQKLLKTRSKAKRLGERRSRCSAKSNENFYGWKKTTQLDDAKKQQREKSQISCQVFFLFLFFFGFYDDFLCFFAALDVLFFTLQIRPGRHKEKRTQTRAGWGTEGRELLMSSSRIFMALWAREWLLYWCILGQVQRCCFRFLSRTVYANRCECVRVCEVCLPA